MSNKNADQSVTLFDIAPESTVQTAEMVTAAAIPVSGDHLSRLLQQYAAGVECRFEIADNIVARFRPMLKAAGGANHDGPLMRLIQDAMKAAEEHGAWKVRNF